MPAALAERLDLELAWERAKLDLSRRRTFACHPFQVDLIDTDPEPWLTEIRQAIHDDSFSAAPYRQCEVPKPHGHIRPGTDLVLADQVVFAALLQDLRSVVQEALAWPSGSPDYSYQLRNDRTDRQWFAPHFARWRAFDNDSIERLDEGATFVVVADIAGYYELVDLSTLRSDLNGLGVDGETLKLLMECLHRWTRVQRRGIPQGHSPSDILGKLYLNAVDQTLRAEGLSHIRWVDDFRVFCTSEAEARRALLVLSRALGRRGLVIQSAKTRLLPAASARAKFNEVSGLLRPLLQDFAQELVDAGVLDAPYVPVWEIDDILEQLADDTPVEVIRQAYHEHFVTAADPFRKTLFHFLLARLGAAGDTEHLDHILDVLGPHPEESDYIAKYAAAVDAVGAFEDRYVMLCGQGLLPYDYQFYQVLRWRLGEPGEINPQLYALAREAALEPGRPWFVRACARAVIGRWGPPEDLEALEHRYGDASSDLERAEIACTLIRMETGRRNAFLGRAAGDGDLTSRAVRAVREGSVRWDAC